jgi:hypothetical protein
MEKNLIRKRAKRAWTAFLPPPPTQESLFLLLPSLPFLIKLCHFAPQKKKKERKWAKGYFTEENVQILSKCMKTCPTSQTTREMQ